MLLQLLVLLPVGQRPLRDRRHRPVPLHPPRLRVCRTRQVRLRHQVVRRVQRPGGKLGQGGLQEVHQAEGEKSCPENPPGYRRLE